MNFREKRHKQHWEILGRLSSGSERAQNGGTVMLVFDVDLRFSGLQVTENSSMFT